MWATEAKLFVLQSDFHRSRENHPVWDLTNSSDGTAIILEPNKYMSINFCLRRRSTVRLTDFRFSNGNNSEIVQVKIDDILMGLFTSTTNPRRSWNVFLSTGPFPRVPALPIGWHKLTVSFIIT
jgi:hypothetical protein